MPTYILLRSLNHSAQIRVPQADKVAVPAGPTAVASGTNSTFGAGAGTYYYKVTAIGQNGGETTVSTEQSAVVGATNDKVTLAWGAVTGAASYRVYRGTSTNAEDHFFAVTDNSYIDTGTAGTAGTPPSINVASYTVGEARLSPTVDTLVNIDNAKTRKALNSHRSIGQYTVTGVNNKLADGTTLPANS